jgi:hypothetical protein
VLEARNIQTQNGKSFIGPGRLTSTSTTTTTAMMMMMMMMMMMTI